MTRKLMISIPPEYSFGQKLYESARTLVCSAEIKRSGKPVILKIQKGKLPPGHRQTLKREYRLLSGVQSNYVAKPNRLVSFGMPQLMEFDDWGGKSLVQRQLAGKLNLSQFFTIAEQIVCGLMDLHAAGIIHKDVNPSNIIYSPEEKKLQLIDLGISSTFSVEQGEFYHPTELEGTIAYISPEQTGRMNRPVDTRTDLYSLGITFYELLTGSQPFAATDLMEMVHAHIAWETETVSQLNPDVPKVLSDIVQTLMKKEVGQRYQSCTGLLHDLGHCQQNWLMRGLIPKLELTIESSKQTFRVTGELLGRDRELSTLFKTFDEVATGQCAFVAVSGEAGIGKTRLVRELFQPVTVKKGVYLAAKFEQFHENNPCAVFSEILAEMAKWSLSESKENLAGLKAVLETALAADIEYLVDLAPEWQVILQNKKGDSEQPGLKLKETGKAAQRRQFSAVKKLLQIFATADSPLVIFIDDWQWMDLASGEMLEALVADSSCPYVMFVCAHRTDEVTGHHPYTDLLKRLNKHIGIRQLALSALSEGDIGELVAKTLSTSQDVGTLANLVFHKAGGNPFFTLELLKTLLDKNLLTFVQTTNQWQWDETIVHSQHIAANVVGLMQQRMNDLDAQVQDLLLTGACIGKSFTLAELIEMHQIESEELTGILEPAFVSGAIAASSSNTCIFAHDRVQQAAYERFRPEQRGERHWQIAQRLLKDHLLKNLDDNSLFAVIHHLEKCPSTIDSKIKGQLWQFYSRAGHRSLKSSAFKAANQYFAKAISRLPPDHWHKFYTLSFNLFLKAALAASLNNQHDNCAQLTETALEQAQNYRDKAAVYIVLIKEVNNRGEQKAAVELAVKALALFGYKYPAEPGEADFVSGLERIFEFLGDTDPCTLAEQPFTDNPDASYVMHIIADVSEAAYHVAPNLLPLMIFTQLELAIKVGNTPETPVAFCLFGLILCGPVGNIEAGYRFGEASLTLLRRSPVITHHAKTLTITNNTVMHWKRPIRLGIEELKEGYHQGIKSGDHVFAGIAYHSYCFTRFFAGANLGELLEEMEVADCAIERIEQTASLRFHRSYYQTAFNLIKAPEAIDVFSGEILEEEKFLLEIEQARDITALFVFYFCKAYLSFYSADFAKSLSHIENAERYIAGATGLFHTSLLVWMRVIALINTKQAKEGLQAVEQDIAKLEHWAEQAPENHRHRLELVKAEQARTLKLYGEAREHYDNAVAAASENDFLQDEAFANLMAGRFYLSRNIGKQAEVYLLEARDDYAEWGANQLVENLTAQYENQFHLIHRGIYRSDFGASSNTQRATSVELLDMGSIFKSVQALSQEINLGVLLSKISIIISENAGAERLVFLEVVAGEFSVLVDYRHNQEDPYAVTEFDPHVLPMSLIQYVERSRKPTFLSRQRTNLLYSKDEYLLKHQPESVLCLPVNHKGSLNTILYMENSLIDGSFSKVNMDVLNILAVQALISLENARFYQRLEDYSHTLKTRVAERTEALQQANKELQRLSFIDGLTKIANRRRFDDYLEEEWSRQMRRGGTVSIVICDVDFFKEYNDTYGHQKGDECLQKLAEILDNVLNRVSDIVARYGGEEFAAVLPETDAEGAFHIANQFLAKVAEKKIPHKSSSVLPYLSLSIGVATAIPSERYGAESLLKAADNALYQAKENGRSQIVVASAC